MEQDEREILNSPPLKDLKPNDSFYGCYLLRSAQSATAKNGKPYLTVRLADNEGELSGKVWDYSGEIGAGDAGRAVWVKGVVEEYQHAPQLRIEQIERKDAAEVPDLGRIVPTAPSNRDAMLKYVEDTLKALGDADCRRLCLAVLERHRDAFAGLPGGKQMHHAFRNGLLMHTANMMLQAEMLSRIYASGAYRGVVNRDLLVAGTFLHDVGKLAEFERSELGLVADYSKEGQLLGHIFLGAEEVGAVGRELGVPEEKLLLLQHLLLSHHGKPEFGAAVMPKCAEAELLSEIDMIDSRMEMYRAAYAGTPEGAFSSQRVYGLNNCSVYRPAAAGETREEAAAGGAGANEDG